MPISGALHVTMHLFYRWRFILYLAICLGSLPVWPNLPAWAAGIAPVTVTATVLAPQAQCTGAFIAHPLDHMTSTADGVVRMFEANGSGLAVNDLDNDGDLDLVLGNHAGPNSILWNEGGLRFRKQTFGEGMARGVTVVDVDNDGRRDLVLTRNTGAVNYWRNTGDGGFLQTVLPGVSYPAYTLTWGDVDQDGDLDLATASYDAGILTDVGNNYLLGGGGGVVYYENNQGLFSPMRLATEAQGLALMLADINGDQRLDIWVGNDFALPDQLWLSGVEESGAASRGSKIIWKPAQPFAQTAYSTMSVDWGDIDNSGQLALFTTDMNPYDISVQNLALWLPVMATLQETHGPDDPQRIANALQVQMARQVVKTSSLYSWRNEAPRRNIDATGWSWAGKFGDLDNDGYLDLYVVNGMIEERMLKHLPNHELVEENQAFRNDGRGRFTPMPGWGLNATYSGRSMVMADLDRDGDLDIVVNNLRAPAMLYENQLCAGASVQVDLHWAGVQNYDAIGAQVILHTSAGSYRRDVRAASGYLSGDAPRLHFGAPVDAVVDHLEVLWPDGMRSAVKEGRTGVLLHVSR